MGRGAKLDGTGGTGERGCAWARACGIIVFAVLLLPLNGGAERRPLRKAAATTALGTTQEANNNVSSGAALDLSSDSGRLISAQAAFDAGQYDDAARIARGPDNQS